MAFATLADRPVAADGIDIAPRCLWLTLADPEPRYSGELIYSGGLIDAAAGAGLQIDVVTGARNRPGAAHGYDEAQNGVRWWRVRHKPRPAWKSLASPLPYLADRAVDGVKAATLRRLLLERRWDGIVFDGISNGWALRLILDHFRGRRDRPRLVYISHNHESSLRERIAGLEPNPIRRRLRGLEAFKVTRLENNLVGAADRIMAITPEDRVLYAGRFPGKRIDVLTPGYAGRTRVARSITAESPRRAVIVGSYEWIAKRANLEEFLVQADPLLASAGVELCIVGNADAVVLARWRQRFPATTFTGTVADVAPYMDDARIAIVPERHGGGFKLKVLDYVFNRMPMLALQGSYAGVPLRRDESVMLFPDHAALARGMIAAIDDIEHLNRLQANAFLDCEDQFSWQSRGALLRSAIAGP